MQTEDLKLAVKKGADWLDQVYPEWLEAIDLDTLDLRDARHCVLGQLATVWSSFSGYDVIQDWAEGVWGPDDTLVFMLDHGFTTKPGPYEDWDDLTEAWTQYIQEHR